MMATLSTESAQANRPHAVVKEVIDEMLLDVAKCHRAALPASDIGSLGETFLQLHHGFYARNPKGLCLAAIDPGTGKVCGFLIAGKPTMRKDFLRYHFWHVAYAVACGLLNPSLRRRVGSAITDAFKSFLSKIGFCHRDKADRYNDEGMFLLFLGTHPDHRRKGIARQLLDAFETESSMRGYHTLRLTTPVDNEAAASVYLRCGWTIWHKDKKLLHFQKTLTNSASISSIKDADLPSVSVIIPCRNEAGFIRQTISSIINNDYPEDKLEILVMDGLSNDGTRDLVAHIAELDSRIHLVDNAKRTAPSAFNKGIKASKGDIIIIIGGHAEADRHFVRNSVLTLLEHPDAWKAGGVMETVGTSYISKVIAAAMGSIIGMGSRKYNERRGEEAWVSAVPFGACWKWVYEKIGIFDESLVRNCDTDFTYRAAKAGAKTRLNGNIRSRYYCRASLYKLGRQQWLDGFWRVRNIQKVGRPAHLRQLVPLAFVLGWIAMVLATYVWPWGKWCLLAYACCYIVAMIGGAAATGPKHGWKIALAVPIAFVIMHFGYGLGTLHGIWSWVILRGKFQPSPESYSLTR